MAALPIGTKLKPAAVEQPVKAEMQLQAPGEKIVKRMKLFGQWEIEGTASNCVARVCSLRFTRLEILHQLESDLSDVAVCVVMQGLRRSLRSDSIPVVQSQTNDVEIDLAFSLQYPHFLKRNSNMLRVMLQRRKKYRRRTILGYKTLAIGELNMSQALQGCVPQSLNLYTKGAYTPSAKLVIASLASQPIDQEFNSSKHAGTDDANCNSSEEECDDDSFSSDIDDSAGELDHGRELVDYDQSPGRRKPSKNLKQKFVSMLFKKLKISDVDLDDVPGELYDDQNEEPDVQDDFMFDEEDDSDNDNEMFSDSISIASNPKPKLRPFFDQLSRNESQGTLTLEREHDENGTPAGQISHGLQDELSGDEASKELSPGSDSDQQKENHQYSNGSSEHIHRSLYKNDVAPSLRHQHRSVSFRERREHHDQLSSSSHSPLRRQGSADFDLNFQVPPVQPLSDQLSTVLTSEESMPEHIFLVDVQETQGQMLAMKLMDRLNQMICTVNDNDVQSVIASVVCKLQKFCNKHSYTPAVLKIGIIGSDRYLNAVLRAYVDQFSPKPTDWHSFIRFLIIPIGNCKLASYIASFDPVYNALFMDAFWRGSVERLQKLSDDVDEIQDRIVRYSQMATVSHSIPVGEALITYRPRSSESDSAQLFLPFVMDVRVGSDSIDLDDPVSHSGMQTTVAGVTQARDIPQGAQANQTSYVSTSPSSRDSSQERHPPPAPQNPVNETLDLQMDYWPIASSSLQLGKKEDKKEASKLSIKSVFKSLLVIRLPSLDFEDPSSLQLIALTKARNKVGVMRLRKQREKDVDSKSSVTALVSKIVCTTKSQSQSINLWIDGVEWTGIKFFSVSSLWPTHVKQFPIGIFGPNSSTPVSRNSPLLNR